MLDNCYLRLYLFVHFGQNFLISDILQFTIIIKHIQILTEYCSAVIVGDGIHVDTV